MPETPAQQIQDAIATSATSGVQSARGDEGQIDEHLLPDRIAAAKFAGSQTAARRRGGGIRQIRVIPPGPISCEGGHR